MAPVNNRVFSFANLKLNLAHRGILEGISESQEIFKSGLAGIGVVSRSRIEEGVLT